MRTIGKILSGLPASARTCAGVSCRPERTESLLTRRRAGRRPRHSSDRWPSWPPRAYAVKPRRGASAATGLRLRPILAQVARADCPRYLRQLELSCHPAWGEQRPDDERVNRDQDDSPERRVRDQHEVRDRAEHRDTGTHIPRPGHSKKDAHTGREQDDAEYQLHPAPAVVGPVIPVRGRRRRDEYVGTREPDDTDDHAPQPTEHH